jgi:hypothetical protein
LGIEFDIWYLALQTNKGSTRIPNQAAQLFYKIELMCLYLELFKRKLIKDLCFFSKCIIKKRTKWKRQTAVGLELLAEAGNFAAVQRMLQQNPYWYHPYQNAMSTTEALCLQRALSYYSRFSSPPMSGSSNENSNGAQKTLAPPPPPPLADLIMQDTTTTTTDAATPLSLGSINSNLLIQTANTTTSTSGSSAATATNGSNNNNNNNNSLHQQISPSTTSLSSSPSNVSTPNPLLNNFITNSSSSPIHSVNSGIILNFNKNETLDNHNHFLQQQQQQAQQHFNNSFSSTSSSSSPSLSSSLSSSSSSSSISSNSSLKSSKTPNTPKSSCSNSGSIIVK